MQTNNVKKDLNKNKEDLKLLHFIDALDIC